MSEKVKRGEVGSAKGMLLVIGGHEDKEGEREILRCMAERVGSGKLVVATVASGKADELWTEYRRIFRDLGVKRVEHLGVDCRDDALEPEAEKRLQGATGVFFTGGDQLRITSQLGDSKVYELIQDIYHRGGTVAGTSAGASVMSETMLISGSGEESPTVEAAIRMAPGLGLIRGVVIDQHFAQRGRLGRLLAAVAQNPRNLGVGIDENTAVIVRGNKNFEVIGEGAVYVLDASGVSYSNLAEEADWNQALTVFDVRLHLLSAGTAFDLETRRPGHLP
jgi:cyanophycinase